MTFIANPIYDVVFKFMMEDDRVAKLLLSALLKKDIVHLELRPHEYELARSPVQWGFIHFPLHFSALTLIPKKKK